MTRKLKGFGAPELTYAEIIAYQFAYAARNGLLRTKIAVAVSQALKARYGHAV